MIDYATPARAIPLIKGVKSDSANHGVKNFLHFLCRKRIKAAEAAQTYEIMPVKDFFERLML